MHGRCLQEIKSAGSIAAALVALACASPASASEPPAGAAAGLYTPGEVAEIDLDLSPQSIAALEAEPDEYVPGDIAVRLTDGAPGGAAGAPLKLEDVGVRLKGNPDGSFRPIGEKAAFKLKLNEFVDGQKLLGLKKLTLNNMAQDPSMLHETLAYASFRAAGVPAPRTGYAFVRVNGEAYGLYMDVETFDDVALERWLGGFDDETQHLYEGEYGSDVSPGGAGAFEVDEGDKHDLADLEALIEAVNASSPAYHERMASIADLSEMTRMWAVEKYIGMWDGYAGTNFPHLPNNFYLYSAGPAGPFQMFPWGTDQAWQGPLEFDGDAGLMFDKCIADPTCKAQYANELRTAGGAIVGLALEPFAECIAGRLGPWQGMEASSFRGYDAEEIEQEVQGTLEMVEDRPGELIEWLEAQSSEAEHLDPSGAPASCAAPALELEPEPQPESGPEPDVGSVAASAMRSSAAASAGPSLLQGTHTSRITAHLHLLGPALVGLRLRVPDRGRVVVLGTFRTRRGSRRACGGQRLARGAGRATVRCRMTRSARRRLRRRWLKLHLVIRFEPRSGAAQTIRQTVVVPRLRRH